MVLFKALPKGGSSAPVNYNNKKKKKEQDLRDK